MYIFIIASYGDNGVSIDSCFTDNKKADTRLKLLEETYPPGYGFGGYEIFHCLLNEKLKDYKDV